LCPYREPSDRARDQQEWDEDIEDEMKDMQEKAEEDYTRLLEDYNVQYALWQEQKKRKVISTPFH
jgi:cell division septum initiation protein DivIVA